VATYDQIETWVWERYGFVPQRCWIAHVRELNGLPTLAAANRAGAERTKPCPPGKRAPIEAAFRHFGMLP